MKFYDIELIDVDPGIENFIYSKISQEDLDCILTKFKNFFNNKQSGSEISFTIEDDIKVVLNIVHFRGMIYTLHKEKEYKSIIKETLEGSIEIAKVPPTKKNKKGKENG